MTRIGREFMDKTRYDYLEPSNQSRGLPQPPLERDLAAGAPLIALPEAQALELGRVELRVLLEGRRSLRRYSRTALSREELSFLLWASQGVKKVVPGSATFRTVPSAGARHALETYLLVNRVQDTAPGLYWYSALRHGLLALPAESPSAPEKAGGAGSAAGGSAARGSAAAGSAADRMVSACLGQEFVKAAAVTFGWAAEVERMRWRYGERGYRYLHLDAGHACQNLYLAAESIGCGACAIAAFSDEAVNELLGLDGEARFALYLAAVGKR